MKTAKASCHLWWPTSVRVKHYMNNKAKAFTAKVLERLQNITKIFENTTARVSANAKQKFLQIPARMRVGLGRHLLSLLILKYLH